MNFRCKNDDDDDNQIKMHVDRAFCILILCINLLIFKKSLFFNVVFRFDRFFFSMELYCLSWSNIKCKTNGSECICVNSIEIFAFEFIFFLIKMCETNLLHTIYYYYSSLIIKLYIKFYEYSLQLQQQNNHINGFHILDLHNTTQNTSLYILYYE